MSSRFCGSVRKYDSHILVQERSASKQGARPIKGAKRTQDERPRDFQDGEILKHRNHDADQKRRSSSTPYRDLRVRRHASHRLSAGVEAMHHDQVYNQVGLGKSAFALVHPQ